MPTTTDLLRMLRHAAAAAALALLACAARAEDIDIFSAPLAQNDLPNVLIIWDSSANWGASLSGPNCQYSDGSGQPKPSSPNKEQGTKMAIEKCAIYNVIYALPTNPDGTALFNVGLMMFNWSGAPQGAFMHQQFVPLTAANKSAFLNVIRNVAINSDKANNGPYAKSMHEAYLVFSKQPPLNGTQPPSPWDASAVAGGRYVGPPGLGCGNNHIIWVSNGSPNENNTESLALLQGDGGNTTQLVYPSSYITNSDQADWADEFARFMRNADVNPNMDGVQSITTHAVAVIGSSSDGLYPNFIKAIAQQGGGQYYAASDVTALIAALMNIFNSIQAANSVFASASLPISVNAQGTYKNQVFVGMFRPDALARTRWYGNLKQYQIAYDPATESLDLVDRFGSKALNAATGFFNPNISSFWTQDSTFWVNDPKGTPPTANDNPDGEVVEKGAIAEQLRIKYKSDQSTRNVYTCITCSGGTNLSLNATERFEDANAGITTAMLGASSATERTAIINWARGNDNAGDEKGPNDGVTTVRPSIHGDVLHSRPAVIDYGGSTGTIVFYGSNDGTLRAVDGNQTGGTAGQELWAFVPSEFYSRLKRLRDDTPEVKYPSTPPTATATPRDYFIDGPITAYQKFDASGHLQQVLIFVSMRRGGRLMYAFDVTTPTSPVMLWRKSSADLLNLGQTWSETRVTRVRGYDNPVLIMGAGYDATAEESSPPGAVTMGNAVMVVDAMTGALVKTLSTSRSVPGAVAILDTDFDGYVDRAYAADMGANVYRIDFETASGLTSPSAWTITKIAALTDDGNTRKFYYAPDTVQTRTFTAILLGSGFRERPLLTTTNDRFYTLLDYKMTKGAPGGSPITDASLVAQGSPINLGTSAGCYLSLDPSGEKVVTSAVSTGGYTYFSTNRPTPPAPNSCAANLGIAKAYRLPLFCGAPESIQLAGGGLPPSPVIGDVQVQVPAGPSDPSQQQTKTVPFIIGGFNAELSGLAVSKVPIIVDPTRRRLFWFTNNAH